MKIEKLDLEDIKSLISQNKNNEGKSDLDFLNWNNVLHIEAIHFCYLNEDNKILGVASISKTIRGTYELQYIETLKEYRRSGLAKSLCVEALSFVRNESSKVDIH